MADRRPGPPELPRPPRAIINQVTQLGTQANVSSPFQFQGGVHDRVYYFRLSALNQSGVVVASDIVSAMFVRLRPPQPAISRIEVNDSELRIFFNQENSYSYQLHWMQGTGFDQLRSNKISRKAAKENTRAQRCTTFAPLLSLLLCVKQKTLSMGEGFN